MGNTATAADVNTTSKNVEFIGFSRNETLHAWRVHVTQPQPNGQQAPYTLIQVFDTYNNELKATFHTPNSANNAAAKKYAPSAIPYVQWQRLQQKTTFSHIRIPTDDTQIRLLADDDMQSLLKAGQYCIGVVGEPGSPIGYQPIAYVITGDLVSLGHYRLPGMPGKRLRTCVEVYASPSAWRVAVLNKFEIPRGDGSYRQMPIMGVLKLPEVIGHNAIGFFNLYEAHERTNEQIFHDLAPDLANLYTIYVD